MEKQSDTEFLLTPFFFMTEEMLMLMQNWSRFDEIWRPVVDAKDTGSGFDDNCKPVVGAIEVVEFFIGLLLFFPFLQPLHQEYNSCMNHYEIDT